jgi:hypothetical protein
MSNHRLHLWAIFIAEVENYVGTRQAAVDANPFSQSQVVGITNQKPVLAALGMRRY